MGDIKTSFGPRRCAVLQSLSFHKSYYPQVVNLFSALISIILKSLVSIIPRNSKNMYISGLIKVLSLALVGADMAAAYACSNAGPASVCSPSHWLFAPDPTYMLGWDLRSSYNLVQAQKATCVRQCRGGSIYIDCSASYVCSPLINARNPQDEIHGLRSES